MVLTDMKQLTLSELPETICPEEKDIETVFMHRDRYIVFSTADEPFEETMAVEVFTSDGEKAEGASLWGLYTPGVLKLHSVGEDTIEFYFWPEILMRLTYLEKPRRILIGAKGVRYTHRLSPRHMLIEPLDPT